MIDQTRLIVTDQATRDRAEVLRHAGDGHAVLLAAVAVCPDRGSELPERLQPSGCCAGAALTECRAGKGKRPGKVTLAECLACVC